MVKKKKTQFPEVFITSLAVGLIAGLLGGLIIVNSFFETIISSQENLVGKIFFPQLIQKEKPTPLLQETKGVSDEERIVNVVEKLNPSVVSIVVTKELPKYYGQSGPDIFNFPDIFDWPFKFSFPEEKQTPEKEKQEIGGGTGFVVDSKGLILTNKHVVSDAEADYTIVTIKGDKYPAEVLAEDPFNDIAVLKVKTEKLNLPEVVLGDSDKLKIGQTVIAIGNALGEYRNTVTKGVISGIGRKIVAGDLKGSEVLENVIQTDAAINFGNSGGPLINLKGEVIGINTAISQAGQLIGFAIPINQAKDSIESVKKTGKIIRPFLGVRYVLITPAMAKANNLPVDYGALVIRGQTSDQLAIVPGSAADKAGIVENDIILEVDGKKITEENSLAKIIQKYKTGDKIELRILHQGKEKKVKVTLGEFK